MTTIKLSDWTRKQICGKLLDYRFGPQELKLKEEGYEIADEVYNLTYSAEERMKMLALPQGWLSTSTGFYVKFGTTFTQLQTREQRRETNDVRERAPILEATHLLSARYEKWQNDKKQLSEERSAAKVQARAALSKASTLNRLLTIWPEIEPFTRFLIVPEVKLPALPISQLNSMFDLPTPADAEPQPPENETAAA